MLSSQMMDNIVLFFRNTNVKPFDFYWSLNGEKCSGVVMMKACEFCPPLSQTRDYENGIWYFHV
jgi:hypothetical protein